MKALEARQIVRVQPTKQTTPVRAEVDLPVGGGLYKVRVLEGPLQGMRIIVASENITIEPNDDTLPPGTAAPI